MTLYRSAVCVLALSVPTLAEARGREGTIMVIATTLEITTPRDLRMIVPAGATTANSATASVKSDAGSEDVTLVESDAWLHGAATIKALPKTDATLALTLYDTASASLISYTGTLTTAGAVTLTADVAKDASADCASRSGCTSSTTSKTPDVEVLAGEVFAATGGYEIAVDLAGADTYEVAYGTFVVTEGKTATKAEIGWDAIGAVWEGDLTLDHEGVVETKVQTYDSAGKKLDSAKAKLGVPWIDGGEGINVLATDEDPLTTVGFLPLRKWTHVAFVQEGRALVVNSEGWTSTTVPVSAKVELTNGGTITIPVNSYQRTTLRANAFADRIAADSSHRLLVTSGSLTLYDSSEFEVGEPDCTGGTCVVLNENEDGDFELSVSEYGTDATKLADKLAITMTIYDKSGVKESSESATVEFDDDVTAVFANEVSFSEDPLGLDLSGKVSLLGAADKKGKQSTLAKGKFYGSFSRDGDGDLDIAGADKDVVSSSGNIVVAGSAVAFELTDTNKDGVIDAPPLVLRLRGIEKSSIKRGMVITR